MTLAAAPKLTPRITKAYECEESIARAGQAMLDAAVGLRTLKDEKLYRDLGYGTWEHYCTERLGWTPQHANRVIEAATIMETLRLKSESIGSLLPTHESQVRPLAAVPEPERAAVWADAVASADGGQPTAAEVEQAAAKVVKKSVPQPVHPATFSDAILAKIAEQLPAEGVVVDPFAGTGRIHELATEDRLTVGVEVQPKWAEMHPATLIGDARHLDLDDGSADAIATSPTYGNRMADSHNANDDSTRLTYTHVHGEPLDEANSGTLQWGPEYRAFHEDAWAEAVRVLKPGGTFVLNIKNHIRQGVEQRVTEWHINALMGHGLELVAIDVVPTRGLMAGENATTRTGHEYVITFRKDDEDVF